MLTPWLRFVFMLSGICGGRVCSPSCLSKKYCTTGRRWTPWTNLCSVLLIGNPWDAACRRSGACCGCCTSQLPFSASRCKQSYLLFSLDPCSIYTYDIPMRFTSPWDLSGGACVLAPLASASVKADLLIQAKVPGRAAEEKKKNKLLWFKLLHTSS